MAALHFAGIPIDECYTAIKNIAKKRADKVLAYKEQFVTGFREAITREGKTQDEADEIARKLWQIVEDSSAYSFNASHSYCVALDSLYGAWLKAHYPLEFYEVSMTVYDQKGDKDKLAELKEEAEHYFKIQFPPFRFRQDNRRYIAVPGKNQIINKLSSIKGFGSSTCNILYQCGQGKYDGFFGVLRWLDARSFKSAKVIPLIKIGYFQEFGNTSQLLTLVRIWDWLDQGTSKQIKKDKVTGDMLELIKTHATDRNAKGTELKSYTITDMAGLLLDAENMVLHEYDLHEVDYRVMVQNQMDILGYVDLTTGKPEDRRKLFIRECYAIEDRWGKRGGVWKYKLRTMSIGSGKTASLTLDPRLYQAKPVKTGDIILCNRDPYKDEKGYWHLVDYEYI